MLKVESVYARLEVGRAYRKEEAGKGTDGLY